MLDRTWEGDVLPLCELCSVGDVVSGFQGPVVLVRATHGSDESAKAPDPLGPSKNSSAFATAVVLVICSGASR